MCFAAVAKETETLNTTTMMKIISIDDQGTLTLPKELRQRLGQRQVVAEETNDGVLLRATENLPVEIYSDARLREFEENNEEALAKFGIKKS